MNGSMIENNEQKKILKKVVVPLIKMVSQHLSKTTKSMQNLRIAGLHKTGVLTHIPDVQLERSCSSFGGFIPSSKKLSSVIIE